MEIEKKRETSWKIQLKKKKEYVEITSVEISGEVRQIKLGLLNKDKSIKVILNKEEFYKFLSLISAFKDVVIGEDSILIENNLEIKKSASQKINELIKAESEPTEQTIENNDTEDLNPEDWDPW